MKSIQFLFYVCIFVSLLFFTSCKKETPSEPEELIPSAVNANTTYTGDISAIGEIDHYLYKPTTNHYIHIVCTEAIQYSDFNPRLSLLDYTTKYFYLDATSYTQAVITNQYVEAGKTYESLVQEWSDDRTGGYTFLIEQDLDDEKNLVINQNRNGKINYVKDYDDFILNISEVGYYHITVKEKTPYSEFNPQISLLDYATKHLLDNETSYTEAVLVNKNLGQNPTYLIRVQEWSNDQPGEYIIKYVKDLDDSVTFTSNPVYYSGKIDYVKDIDKMYFKPSLGGNYKVVLAEKIPNSEFNPQLRIFGEFNNLLQTKSAYDSAVVNMNLEAFKVYGIEVIE